MAAKTRQNNATDATPRSGKLILMGLLACIRTAHYWTVLHPELSLEEDVRDLLKVNEERFPY